MSHFPPGGDELLYGDEPRDDRQRELQFEAVRNMELGRKKAFLRMTAWVLCCIAFLYVGLWFLLTATNPRTMLLAFFVAITGLETSVLVKLWFWIVDGRNATLKELKQVQLQLAELAERLEGPGHGTAKGEE